MLGSRRGLVMPGASARLYVLLNSSIYENEKYRYLKYEKNSLDKHKFRKIKLKLFQKVFSVLIC